MALYVDKANIYIYTHDQGIKNRIARPSDKCHELDCELPDVDVRMKSLFIRLRAIQTCGLFNAIGRYRIWAVLYLGEFKTRPIMPRSTPSISIYRVAVSSKKPRN